jgi:DNA-binding transcriptional regulator YdaS (Cro superfamily)
MLTSQHPELYSGDMNALRKAIALAGGPTALAKDLEVSPQAVCNWAFRGNVPPQYAPQVEQKTGVAAEFLCPDIHWHIIRGKPAPT